MKSNLTTVLAVLSVLILGVVVAHAQTFTTLYSFSNTPDGSFPEAGVVLANNTLYGTTAQGGNGSDGTVFSLTTGANPTETVLYSFLGTPDAQSTTTPVALDSNGNIYGTSSAGGAFNKGAVYEIDNTGNETVIYSFTGNTDGCLPAQGVFVDSLGNLYGTTNQCGDPTANAGTIYKIDTSRNFTVLHTFLGGASDGASPTEGHLIMDDSGNLYGLAFQGGTYNSGVLYKLTAAGTFIILNSFGNGSTDAAGPIGTVTLGNDKYKFYGASLAGGSGYGTVWAVTAFVNRKEAVKSTEKLLYTFTGGSDGGSPYGGVVFDGKGHLYGVTLLYGEFWGTLYKVSVAGTKFEVLHRFGFYPDGGNPLGELLLNNGTIYGTTSSGGAHFAGTVFSYVLNAQK